jgi:mRNA interferase MazF
MHPIHLAKLDKTRPVVVLTRPVARDRMRRITVATITSTVRGLTIEVPVGPENGLDQACVINCDTVDTIPAESLGRQIGYLLDSQEAALNAAIRLAFDLD